MIWFVKSTRAHSDDDYETWVEGGVCPTLNGFDNNHETRSTVLVLIDKDNNNEGHLA